MLVNESINRNNNTKKKYCRFKKFNFKYVPYLERDFLLKFVNDQGKIYPRRLSGTSSKYQKKLTKAIKRSRHLAILPFTSDELK